MLKTNLSNRAVESVISKREQFCDAAHKSRRDTKAFEARRAHEENVVRVERVGPFDFEYLKFSEIRGQKMDTSKKFFHVGGGKEKYRSNRVWDHRSFGHFRMVGTTARMVGMHVCNPQVAGVHGPRLPSNPLPPFVRNDGVKARPVQEEKELPEETRFRYMRDECVDEAVKRFCYDAFLSDEQNVELVESFRKRIADSKFVSQSGGEFETPMTSPLNISDAPIARVIEAPLVIKMDVIEKAPDAPREKSAREIEQEARIIADWEVDQLINSHGPVVKKMIYEKVAGMDFKVRDLFQMVHQDKIGALPKMWFDARQMKIDAMYAKTLEEPVTSSDDESEEEKEPGWLEIPSFFKKTLVEARSAVNEVRTTLPKLSTIVERTSDQADELITSITRMLEPLTRVAGSLVDSVLPLAGHLANLIYDIVNYKSYSLGVMLFKSGFAFSQILGIVVPHLRAHILPKLVSQSKSQYSMEDFLCMFTGNKVLLETGKTMNALAQIRNGFRSVKEFAVWIRSRLPMFLQEIVEQYWPSETQVVVKMKALMEIMMGMSISMEQRRAVSMDDALDLRFRLLELAPILSVPSQENRDISNVYRNARTQAVKILAYAEQYTKLATPRQCPFSIVFHGETRVGKSVLMSRVASTLSQVMGWADKSYVRQSGVPHWDGYSDDTFAVIFDDWLQKTTYEDVPEFFSLSTKQHYIVPMASLDDPVVGRKGTLCLSPLVLAATNLANKQAVSTAINSPDALFARIGMRVRVTRVGDYQLNMGHQRYQIYLRDDEQGSEEWTHLLTYDNMMERVVLAMRDHFANQTRIDESPDSAGFVEKLKNLFLRPGFVSQSMMSACISAGVCAWTIQAAYYYGTDAWRMICNQEPPKDPEYKPVAYASFAIMAATLVGAAFTLYSVCREEVVLQVQNQMDVELLNFCLTGETKDWNVMLEHEKWDKTERGNKLRAVVRRLTKVPKSDPDYELVQEHLERGKQFYTESRTFEERGKARPKVKTESRTLEEKGIRRPLVVTEGNPALHSKVLGSPFYSQQDKIRQAFEAYEHKEIDDDEVTKLMNPKFLSQSASDSQAMAQASVVLSRMMPVSLAVKDYTKTYVGTVSVLDCVNAIPVSSSVCLLPKHFFYGRDGRQIKSDDMKTFSLVFLRNGVSHPVDFEPRRLVPLLNKSNVADVDAVLYDLAGTTMPALRSCMSLFVREEELALVRTGLDATMIGYTLRSNKPVAYERSFQLNVLQKMVSYAHAQAMFFLITRGFTYNTPTQAGDCGSPILAHQKALIGKIVGIHSFGSADGDTAGGATLITQDMIERMLVKKDVPVVEQTVTFTATDRFNELKLQAQGMNLELIGEVDHPVYVSRKTAFRPTPLLEHFEKFVSVPSEKYDSEGSDPLIVGALLFGSEFQNIDDTFKERTLTYLASKYEERPAKVLSTAQAVNTYGAMKRLNLNTSAGYPHVTQGKSKRTFLEFNEASELIEFKNEDEEKRVADYVESWRTCGHEVMWVMALKDCLDKPGKLCRVFEVPPYEYTIATRAYFGAWIDMMHSTVGNHFCCVGMNPESLEWSAMTYKLLGKSEYGIDADAPNFDKNLSATLVYWAIDSINRWYQRNDVSWTQGDDDARLRITDAMLHAFIIAGWLLLRKFKGMPSGYALTALLNSIVNMIMHLIWYLKSVPVEMRSIALYDENVQTVVYGDDSMDAIRVHLLEYLNRQSMMEVYQRYCSMTITSSQKDNQLRAFDKVTDLTFLRRGFRLDGFIYKPTLALRSMYSMLCYTRVNKYASQQEQLFENMRVFTSFLYFYGQGYYEDAMAYLGRLFPGVLFPEYHYYDELFRYGTVINILN